MPVGRLSCFTKDTHGQLSQRLRELQLRHCVITALGYILLYILIKTYLYVCLCSTSQTDISVIKHILQQHSIKELTSSNDEDVQHLRVRRSHIFSDALRQFSKDSFNCSKLLRVRFIGEAAVDDGGPRRELFHLVIQEMFKSSYFSGFPYHVVPVHNVEALAKKYVL